MRKVEENPLSVDDLRAHVQKRDDTWLSETAERLHPVHAAEALVLLDDPDIAYFLTHIDPRDAAVIFAEVGEDDQDRLVTQLTRRQLAKLVTHMSHDERADIVNRLSPSAQRQLLPALSYAEHEDIRRLASYPEESAGAVMTSDYTVLRPQLTVHEAMETLRRQALDRETIYYAYVVDSQRRLIGMLTLKDLVLAQPEETVEEVMSEDLVLGRLEDDQEDIARTISKFDLLALPILDQQDRLVGIVTYDDAIDIIRQEHTEDLEKLMAITGGHQVGGYLKTSSWMHFRNRVTWIIVLAIMGLLSGFILHSFEATLSHLIILALYMPMIADTGGNAGSQTATVVIQALTLKDIEVSDIFRVLAKELQISALLSVVLGSLAMAKVYLFSHGTVLPGDVTLFAVACSITLALSLQVISAALMGAALPLLALRFKLDPAVVASPAITTVVDISGLLIYFFTAKLLLGV
jgi:magnesium transporter